MQPSGDTGKVLCIAAFINRYKRVVLISQTAFVIAKTKVYSHQSHRTGKNVYTYLNYDCHLFVGRYNYGVHYIQNNDIQIYQCKICPDSKHDGSNYNTK